MVGRSVTTRPWAPCSFRTPLLSVACVGLKRSVADMPERNQFARPFRLVRADHDRLGGQGLLHQGHGLGRLGRVDARLALYVVYRWKCPGRRADGPAGGRAEDRARRRPGSAMSGSTTWTLTADRVSAPWWSRACPADRRCRHQPLFDLLRSANGEARVAQMAETRSRAACRAGCARPRRLARAARRRLGAGIGLLRASFLAGKVRTPTAARWARISCSLPEGRPSAACCTKPATMPAPFWLYYFNVDRHRRGGAAREGCGWTRSSTARVEVPGGSWIIQCADPQGAMFALEGMRGRNPIGYFERVTSGDPSDPRGSALVLVRQDIPSIKTATCPTAVMAGSRHDELEFVEDGYLSRKSPIARRDRAQTGRPGPRRGIRSPSSSRTDRCWCSRSRIRRAPCRSPSGRAFASIRRRPSE